MTYCVVVDKELAVSRCPLPDGACFWKHRSTGLCTYSEYTAIKEDRITLSTLSTLVGILNPITDAEASKIKGLIRESLKQGI